MDTFGTGWQMQNIVFRLALYIRTSFLGPSNHSLDPYCPATNDLPSRSSKLQFAQQISFAYLPLNNQRRFHQHHLKRGASVEREREREREATALQKSDKLTALSFTRGVFRAGRRWYV
jgi:hypothetical protein